MGQSQGASQVVQWKRTACQCRTHSRLGFDPWVRKIPWRKKWQPTPLFLPGKFHGQKNLAGYSPQGLKVLDMTENNLDLDLEKAEESEIKLPTSVGSSKRQESSRKISISALLTMPKPLTVWITRNWANFWKRWEYQTTWLASWETYMQVRKQQLELDTEQHTGSK